VFRDLTDQDLSLVAEWTEIRRVAAGERVVQEGETGFSFFVIVEGSAVVHAGDRGIASLGAGDNFGEMAIEEDGTRRADIVATSPSTLGVMIGKDFQMMEREFPAVAARIRREARGRRSAL
jgi:CRP-like cAMP-binding protein